MLSVETINAGSCPACTLPIPFPYALVAKMLARPVLVRKSHENPQPEFIRVIEQQVSGKPRMNRLKEDRDGARRKGLGNTISGIALLALAGFQLAGGGKVLGQGADVSAKFPELSQVQADYPDEAERYAAFQVLDRALRIAAPKPVSRPAYDKLFNYEGADLGLDNLHLQQGMQSQAYRDWVARRDGVLTNAEFARSVLAKYQLTAYAHAPRPASVGSPGTTINGQPVARPTQSNPGSSNPGSSARPITPQAYMVSPAKMHQAFFVALPIGVLSFVVMFVVPWLMLDRSGSKVLRKVAHASGGGSPPLPEPLQVIHLRGVRYTVTTFCGLVLDKQTIMRTYSSSYTTPGQVHTVGNTSTYVPGQTVSHTTTVRNDVLRMRMPDGSEKTWTFTGESGANVFAGQMLSAAARPLDGEFSEFLLAYNHNTGELVPVEQGLDNANRPRGILNFLGQPVAMLIGTIGFYIVLGYFVTKPPYVFTIGPDWSGVIFLLFSAFCSLTVAYFMVNWIRYRVRSRRNACVMKQYGPRFRQFFDQCAPVFKARLGIR